MVIVSACDGKFYRCLQQLLLSLQRHNLKQCVFYDLGLSGAQRRDLRQRFPWVELGPPLPWDQLPAHLRKLGNYAWKPYIVEQEVLRRNCPVMWMDSACVVVGSLQPVLDHIRQFGVWAPWGGGCRLEERTHPHVLEALAIEEPIRKRRFYAGTTSAYDPSVAGVRELLQSWRELSWVEDLIDPPGASRANHRYDQTLLSVVIGRSGLNPGKDALDISDPHPVPYLRARNKVKNSVPLWLDPLLRIWFWCWREVDVRILRWREGRSAPLERTASL